MKANPTIGLWRTLALVLTLALLAACGKGGGGGAEAPAGVDNPTTPAVSTTATKLQSALGAGFPQIAMNANGDAVVVWTEFESSAQNCVSGLLPCFTTHSTRYTSAGWDIAVPIQTTGVGTETSFEPQVAIDPTGNALAVWTQLRGATAEALTSDVRSNRYANAASTWDGGDRLMENGIAIAALSPQVAMGNNGGIAVWVQDDDPDPTDQVAALNIWASRYTLAGGWDPAELISGLVGDETSPQVSINDAGVAIAVWEQFDGVRTNIYASRKVGAGVWDAPQEIDSGSNNAAKPQIAINSAGVAIAVWEQFDGVRTNIYASRKVGAGVWDAPQEIDSGSNNAAKPQIAINSAGVAIAVWEQFDGTRTNVYSNTYDGAWGIAGLVETDNASNAEEPQVAIDAGGVAVAVWQQNDTSRYNVWTSTRQAGGAWNDRLLLEVNEGSAKFPQVVIDPTSNFAIAVWDQQAGAGGPTNVWANRFSYK